MKTKAFLNNQVQKETRRNALDFGIQYLLPMGYANGYVAVPPGHPLHGKHYDEANEVIDIHGGLTFAAVRSDCEWDAECIEMIDGGTFADIPQDWWVFGFDTMHFNDGPKHGRKWCIRETKHLQQQLEKIGKEEKAMKKIMFNDRYGLTEAVLEGRKTMTRRVERIEFYPGSREEQIEKFSKRRATDAKGRQVWLGFDNKGNWIAQLISRYAIGEEVAVAQAYQTLRWPALPGIDWKALTDEVTKSAGWKNKMFVKAEYMPYRIRITNIKVERLQNISDEDIYKEGFDKVCINNGWGNAAYHWETLLVYYDGLGRTKEIRSCHPKEAFAALIDKVSGRGTWERNPWVFAYTFELMR